jgi:membrane-associated protease RseP (regulator of RpoE activity)
MHGPTLLFTSLSFYLSSTSALALPFANPFAHADAEPQTSTYNNGQWTTAATQQYGGGATTSAAASWQATSSAAAGASWTATSAAYSQVTITGQSAATAVTSAPHATGSAAAGGWEQSVTWPAGCQTWANPCPSGAHVSGGSVVGGQAATSEASGYTNGFTSYTTMTNSDGVITGMPSKATVAAGVSTIVSGGSTLSTVTLTSGNGSVITPTGSKTQTGFSAASTSSVRATFTGAARPMWTGVPAAILGVAGVAAAFL